MPNGTQPQQILPQIQTQVEVTPKPSMLTSNRWKATLLGLVMVVAVYLIKEIVKAAGLEISDDVINKIAMAIVGLIGTYIVGRTATDLQRTK